MLYLTAEEIMNLLIKQGVKDAKGGSLFTFLGVEYVNNDKNPLGYLFQNWFSEWLKNNNIYFRSPENTQDFPDFYLSTSNTDNLLEVKTFDSSASANFDIANFEAYTRSLRTKPHRLFADYLIFSYKLVDGEFSIDNLWLKKIWEITCESDRYPLKTQIKQDVIYNIRPATWYSKNTTYKPFNDKTLFIKALYYTLKSYPKTSAEADSWLADINKFYI